jgi:hypothetical protein
MNRQEFLANGGLDFTVSKRKMLYEGIYDGTYNTPFFCTVNDMSAEALGPVRGAYTVKQNAELLDIVLDKIGEGNYDLSKSTCGAFNHGRKVFFFIKHSYDTSWQQEPAESYVYALSSHDGSQRLTFGVANRIHSCSNMFGLLMNDKENNHTIKHTKGINSLSKNKEIDNLIKRNLSGIASIMKKMQGTDIDQVVCDKIKSLIANIDTKRVNTSTKDKRKLLENCIYEEYQNKGRTYYGFFNGITNYLTHFATKERNEIESITYNIAGEGSKVSSKALNMIVNNMKERGCLN